jgi:hypothetical protein
MRDTCAMPSHASIRLPGSDADRALAFANIQKAAKYYNVDLSEASWRELSIHPQRHRKEAAAKAAATRRRNKDRSGTTFE